MLSSLSNLLFRRARWVYIFPLLLICVGYVWLFNFSTASFANPAVVAAGCGQEVLDVRLRYGAELVYEALECYGPAGRAAYTKFLLVDASFAAFYGLTFSLLMSWFVESAKARRSALRWAQLVPLGIALADTLENALLSRLLSTFPTQHLFLADLAGLATTAKWALSALTTAILLAVATHLVWRRVLGR